MAKAICNKNISFAGSDYSYVHKPHYQSLPVDFVNEYNIDNCKSSLYISSRNTHPIPSGQTDGFANPEMKAV